MRFGYLVAGVAFLMAAPASAAVLASGAITSGSLRTLAFHEGARQGETWRYRFSWTGIEDGFTISVEHGEEYTLSSILPIGDRFFINANVSLGSRPVPFTRDGLSISWEASTTADYGAVLTGFFPAIPAECARVPANVCGRRLRMAVETISFIKNDARAGTWTLEGELIAVPEPGTWALLIAGFGAVGAAARRRRRAFA